VPVPRGQCAAIDQFTATEYISNQGKAGENVWFQRDVARFASNWQNFLSG
jgi:hypothetical protein